MAEDHPAARLVCRRCGGDHEIVACLYVKAIEFDDDGDIARVEFLTPADYPPAPPVAPTAPIEKPTEVSYPKL
jgi:hypothetical protein